MIQRKSHQVLMRIPLLASLLGVAALICPPPLQGEEEKAPQASSPLPALKMLPEGSILQKCRFPRYDKDFNPSSLLTADLLTVGNKNKINGTNITIFLYNKAGSEQGRCSMLHAIYDQSSSIITANKTTTLKSESFQATGTGLIFHLLDKKMLLLGPASSTIYKKLSPDTSSTMFNSPTHHSRQHLTRPIILAATVLSFACNATATPPAKLTPEELTTLDTLSAPQAAKIKSKQTDIKQTITTEKQLQTTSEAKMKPFFKKIDKEKLLVTSTKQIKTKAKKTTAAPKKEKGEKPETLYIECDNGIYFDSDTGLLVYLKNIHLTAPTFSLACSDELKIFLEKKETLPQKNLPLKEKKKTSPSNSFGQAKRIIATGHVKLINKDENGKIYIATAETASYNPKTGVMILRGGLPRIQYGKNQYLQSKAPGQYIKMLKSGKLITTGKWAMQIDTKQKP